MPKKQWWGVFNVRTIFYLYKWSFDVNVDLVVVVFVDDANVGLSKKLERATRLNVGSNNFSVSSS